MKRSVRIGETGEADKEVRIGNHTPEEMLLVAALFNGTPACTQANGEQKLSLGIKQGDQLVVYQGKAVEFRRAIIGAMNHNGRERRKGFVDPTALTKAVQAAEEIYTSVGWQPGDPIPATS